MITERISTAGRFSLKYNDARIIVARTIRGMNNENNVVPNSVSLTGSSNTNRPKMIANKYGAPYVLGLANLLRRRNVTTK